MKRLVHCVLLLACCFGFSAEVSAECPNIVLIMADDFGWGDASCNNPQAVFQTPNLDRIAAEGIRLTGAFTPHSVCSPTRYALLTGRYAWRSWMREGVLPGYAPALIPPTRTTLASLLKKKGYATGAFGKWHVGVDWAPVEGDPGDWHWGTQVRERGVVGRISRRVDHGQPVSGPTKVGFDTCLITPSNNTRIPIFIRDDHVDGTPRRDPSGLMRDPRVKRDEVDDVFVAEAIKFMRVCVAEQPERPFFVYLPLNAAHGATVPPERFKDKTEDGRRGDKCLWVNESVGKMLDALDELDRADDTLVIFTADNGPIAPQIYKPGTKHRAAGPYRGYKTDAWDGGFRVPLLARWPGHIPEGISRDGLFCLTDLLATFAALVGEELPHWAGEDSFNQLPLLLGQEGAESARNSLITQSYIGVLSIRADGWKLILDTKGSGGHQGITPNFKPVISGPPWEINKSHTGQLYHVACDPEEKLDLFGEKRDIVVDLKRLLQKQISDGRSRP
jgi:arylsulfatase A-like enzyme